MCAPGPLQTAHEKNHDAGRGQAGRISLDGNCHYRRVSPAARARAGCQGSRAAHGALQRDDVGISSGARQGMYWVRSTGELALNSKTAVSRLETTINSFVIVSSTHSCKKITQNQGWFSLYFLGSGGDQCYIRFGPQCYIRVSTNIISYQMRTLHWA